MEVYRGTLYIAGNPTPYRQNVNGGIRHQSRMPSLTAAVIVFMSWFTEVVTFLDRAMGQRRGQRHGKTASSSN